MKYSQLPNELQEELRHSTGWTAEQLDTWSAQDIWCILTSKRPETMEWLYQLLFGIPLLKARLTEAVSCSNCQVAGISGAWQEAVEALVRFGHHEDDTLKTCAKYLLRGYEERAQTILTVRELLRCEKS